MAYFWPQQVMAKKKIAFFIVSLYGGGAERVASILLKHLQHQYDIHLVMLDNCIEYELPQDQKIHLLDKRPVKSHFVNILKIPLLAWRYRRFLKQHQIETSFSFLSRPNFIACCLKLLRWKGEVIINERQFTSYYYNKKGLAARVGYYLVKWLYPRANRVVCNAALIAADLRQSFGVDVPYTVINNPIDLDEVARKLALPDEPDAVPPTGRFTFVTVGRFSAEKNQQLLIEAASLVKGFDFTVQIIGKGPQQAQLEALIQKLGVADRVVLVPHTPNPFQYLKQAHCFVLPSHSEGFPNVILEAMACGLPVIATDCKSGPRELLAPGMDTRAPEVTEPVFCDYGILVPVNNAAAMAKAMEWLYQHPTASNEYKTKSTLYSKNFTVMEIIDKFATLFKPV
jgi:N-acetylgalactosamine-N,N'-diacetylbacillosaminyl-diphospho-undecaprenol 4-alpha-N-acetylgalactosaminyltransferase